MVGHFRIVNDPVCMDRKRKAADKRKDFSKTVDQLWDQRLHVMRKEPTVGARVSQQFFLIQVLRVFQRLLGGKAEILVGFPLQRGQVIEKDLLDKLLERNAISQAEYDKSFGDLTWKMGVENVLAENIAGGRII